MAETLQTLQSFLNLPAEIQCQIWKEAIQQTPPRIFELLDHEPEETYYSDMRIEHREFHISELTLYERSVAELQRPLLGIDKASREENLKSYEFVKFLNAHIYINLKTDLIYFGHFRSENLRSMFHLKEFPFRYRDSFWPKIQHLACGMEEVVEMLAWVDHRDAYLSWRNLEELRDYSARGNKVAGVLDIVEIYHGKNEEGLKSKWGLEDLQQFPALKSFTLVLDAIEKTPQWPPRINGHITLEKISESQKPYGDWVRSLRGKWRELAESHPEWNVPVLNISFLSRDGRIQQVDWKSDIGEDLTNEFGRYIIN